MELVYLMVWLCQYMVLDTLVQKCDKLVGEGDDVEINGIEGFRNFT